MSENVPSRDDLIAELNALRREVLELRRQAAEEGVGVADSEIVGLVPERALPPDADRRLRLRTPAAERVLEARIRSAYGG